MRVLALDTTTRAGSAALLDGDRLDERRGDLTRTHAERLPLEVTALPSAHGLALAAIDLFAVASGPGSFTGLRIGIATMQGLAFVTGRPIVGVSALEAFAQVAAERIPAGALAGVWMDAQRGEVFAALYRVTGAEPFAPARVEEIEEPVVGDPSLIADRWRAAGAVTFTGDGAARYRHLLGGAAFIDPLPLAGAIARMAAARAARGESAGPAAVRPLYIRRPDAEIDRDRRALARGTAP